MSNDIENTIAYLLEEVDDITFETKYSNLYEEVENQELKLLFLKLHSSICESFKLMNQRLPTHNNGNHFWAEDSRILLKSLEVLDELYEESKDTKYSFIIDDYYYKTIKKCKEFLCKSGGSTIPPNMKKIKIYLKKKIFYFRDTVNYIQKDQNLSNLQLKIHGEGSYAIVYRYKDPNYNKKFIIKRAKQNISEKELERFKQEFKSLSSLDSPYIIEVFKYNEEKNEYSMEYMDCTLKFYIDNNNDTLNFKQRKKLILQILKGFEYIHKKGMLHRDISPNNILLKTFEDGTVVTKIADFGLVKIKENSLTSINTEFKGSFNDPSLMHKFKDYSLEHEIYAISYLIYYILTGKTKLKETKNSELNKFIDFGMNNNYSKRYKDINDLTIAFNKIKFND